VAHNEIHLHLETLRLRAQWVIDSRWIFSPFALEIEALELARKSVLVFVTIEISSKEIQQGG